MYLLRQQNSMDDMRATKQQLHVSVAQDGLKKLENWMVCGPVPCASSHKATEW